MTTACFRATARYRPWPFGDRFRHSHTPVTLVTATGTPVTATHLWEMVLHGRHELVDDIVVGLSGETRLLEAKVARVIDQLLFF
jgi:hypothetical protein